MKSKTKSQREYPWTERIGSEQFTFRLMTSADRKAVLAFTSALPAQDIMFLRKDITKEAVVDDWIEKIEKGQTVTVVAESESGVIAGYASLHLDQLLWTHHLGEIRVVLAKDMRGKGLARRLVNEMFQIARDRGLQRLVVNMRRDQEHVRAMLNRLGFKAEALLTDWLMDANGVTHDLLVMSCYVNEV